MASEVAVLNTVLADRLGHVTPEALRAEADEIRSLMRSVLEEGVDFGRIPGTPKPTLFKSGAEWLQKWARLGHRKTQVALERDEDGKPYGVTYRVEVYVLDHPDIVVATADGYCGYDEPDREAHTTWNGKPVPRAPWNTMIQMAQKRAMVSATLQATAASGLFTQDVADMPEAPVAPADPEAWFTTNGWLDKQHHDEWLISRREAVRVRSDEDRALIKDWCDANRLSFARAVPHPLAEHFDGYLASLERVEEMRRADAAVLHPDPPAPTPPASAPQEHGTSRSQPKRPKAPSEPFPPHTADLNESFDKLDLVSQDRVVVSIGSLADKHWTDDELTVEEANAIRLAIKGEMERPFTDEPADAGGTLL